MTFTDYEKDPNHITFDFIKYYYSKLSLDSAKLYQIYSKNAVIKHSESTKTHDYNTPESIKKYWKGNSFLANSKIIILTVNTVENSDSSLVATVVGEILLEKDYTSSTNDDIIPTRPFTQTFVLEKEESKDAYLIKSDILTFIPDTNYEKAQLIENNEIELVENTKQDNTLNIDADKVKAEEPNGHTEKVKIQQEVVETKAEPVKEQTIPEINKETSEKGKINKVTSEQKVDSTPSPASSNSEKSTPTAPSTPNSSNATVKSSQSDTSNTTVTTNTTTTETVKSSITTTQTQSAPTTPPSGTKPKPTATEKPALIQGSWASAIKTSTSTNTLPSSVSHASISPAPNTSKVINDEPFTTVRSHSPNSNSGSNLNSNSNKKNSKTHPFEVFVQFKHAALPPKEKDLDEALKKKNYKGYKISVFKPINAIVAFTTKEEQTRALEMKNILHKEVDYFIDVKNPKSKKKTYNNSGDRK